MGGALAAQPRRRLRGGRHRCGGVTRGAAPAVVEAEVIGEGAETVAAVLERAEREGVPVRNLSMEYSRAPRRSPLQQCGIPAVEGGGPKATETLVKGLLAGGASEDQAEVGAAVLCLMLGGVDEAHNLVTPHSWPSPTAFGGPAKHGSPVRKEAAYCHVIVHRMEAENPGEFGTGFNNSGYWIGNAFGGSEHPIFPQLLVAARERAEGCPDAVAGMRTMGARWDPRGFNRLCADALELEDEDLLAFCKDVQSRELRLLFDHTMDMGRD